MRVMRARKAKTSRGRKDPVKQNGQLEKMTGRGKPGVDKPPRVLSQPEHLQGLWVTLGLADVAD